MIADHKKGPAMRSTIATTLLPLALLLSPLSSVKANDWEPVQIALRDAGTFTIKPASSLEAVPLEPVLMSPVSNVIPTAQ